MYGIKDDILQNVPQNGYLNDGRSVINYDLLPIGELIAEGWSELQEGEMPTEEQN